ncbi:hypothetical protein BT67DRAFT_491220 [Trichocladium antarcticum]|uniref:Uncharacterized protein n=1 Tax=Trichocladium antarcticum TaxID=1450529 RepID=A0AAN6ZFY6_9PEZI|nr:hypothetical protein BT67DRAFT_491220 [Trichocladium antarcticum]
MVSSHYPKSHLLAGQSTALVGPAPAFSGTFASPSLAALNASPRASAATRSTAVRSSASSGGSRSSASSVSRRSSVSSASRPPSSASRAPSSSRTPESMVSRFESASMALGRSSRSQASTRSSAASRTTGGLSSASRTTGGSRSSASRMSSGPPSSASRNASSAMVPYAPAGVSSTSSRAAPSSESTRTVTFGSRSSVVSSASGNYTRSSSSTSLVVTTTGPGSSSSSSSPLHRAPRADQFFHPSLLANTHPLDRARVRDASELLAMARAMQRRFEDLHSDMSEFRVASLLERRYGSALDGLTLSVDLVATAYGLAALHMGNIERENYPDGETAQSTLDTGRLWMKRGEDALMSLEEDRVSVRDLEAEIDGMRR